MNNEYRCFFCFLFLRPLLPPSFSLSTSSFWQQPQTVFSICWLAFRILGLLSAIFFLALASNSFLILLAGLPYPCLAFLLSTFFFLAAASNSILSLLAGLPYPWLIFLTQTQINKGKHCPDWVSSSATSGLLPNIATINFDDELGFADQKHIEWLFLRGAFPRAFEYTVNWINSVYSRGHHVTSDAKLSVLSTHNT